MAAVERVSQSEVDSIPKRFYSLAVDGRQVLLLHPAGQVSQEIPFEQIGKDEENLPYYFARPIEDIDKELIPILRKYDDSISAEDLIISYRQRLAISSLGPDEVEEGVQIYDIQFTNNKVSEAIKQAADEGAGVVLLTVQQIRDGGIIEEHERMKWVNGIAESVLVHEVEPLKSSVEEIEVYVLPDTNCRLLLSADISPLPIEITPQIYGTLYNAAKEIVFRAEPADSYRLNKSDLGLLRLYANPKLVDELEKSIVIHRCIVLATKMIQGVSEGGLVGTAASDVSDDRIRTALQIVTTAGIIASYAADRAVSRSAKDQVKELLSQVLFDIQKKFRLDEEELHLPDMRLMIASIVPDIADAEEIAPIMQELSPSFLAINGILLQIAQIQPALMNVGLYLGGVYTLGKASGGEKLKTEQWSKIARNTVIQSIAGMLNFSAPIIGGLAANIADSIGELGIYVAAFGFSTAHIASRFEVIDEIGDS